MKTMGFSTVELELNEVGNIALLVEKPGSPLVSVSMSPDEMMIFLVECTNRLHEARLTILLNIQERDLKKEQRKVKT